MGVRGEHRLRAQRRPARQPAVVRGQRADAKLQPQGGAGLAVLPRPAGGRRRGRRLRAAVRRPHLPRAPLRPGSGPPNPRHGAQSRLAGVQGTPAQGRRRRPGVRRSGSVPQPQDLRLLRPRGGLVARVLRHTQLRAGRPAPASVGRPPTHNLGSQGSSVGCQVRAGTVRAVVQRGGSGASGGGGGRRASERRALPRPALPALQADGDPRGARRGGRRAGARTARPKRKWRPGRRTCPQARPGGGCRATRCCRACHGPHSPLPCDLLSRARHSTVCVLRRERSVSVAASRRSRTSRRSAPPVHALRPPPFRAA